MALLGHDIQLISVNNILQTIIHYMTRSSNKSEQIPRRKAIKIFIDIYSVGHRAFQNKHRQFATTRAPIA